MGGLDIGAIGFMGLEFGLWGRVFEDCCFNHAGGVMLGVFFCGRWLLFRVRGFLARVQRVVVCGWEECCRAENTQPNT